MWAPAPIEIKLFSTDTDFLKAKAPEIEQMIQGVRGVVDTFDGLVYTGNSIHLCVRTMDAERLGLSIEEIASAVHTAMLGRIASSVLEGDRIIEIRVLLEPAATDQLKTLQDLLIRTPAEADRIAEIPQMCLPPDSSGCLKVRDVSIWMKPVPKGELVGHPSAPRNSW